MLPFLIRTPGELSKAVRVVRANLMDGTLDQIGTSRFASKRPFLDVGEQGPWDDLLSYGFKCRECGQPFELSAETYHGGGGQWTPRDPR